MNTESCRNALREICGISGFEKTKRLIIAPENSDLAGLVMGLEDLEQEKFNEGLEICRDAFGLKTEDITFVHFPDDDIVDMRAAKDAVVLHPASLVKLAGYARGNAVDCQYVSVNGGPLTRVRNDSPLSSLAGLSGKKAALAGYIFYTPAEKETPAGSCDLGNGVFTVFDDSRCIVDETLKILQAYQSRCCGKCVFCREGLNQLAAMHKDITTQKAGAEYLSIIRETGEAMREGAFCDLGKKSALTVLSALEKFQGEYESHIRNRACPAGVCVSPSRSLFYIDPVLCDGCTDCMEACPEDCIEGKAGFIHVIEQEDCVKCGKCAEACARGAVKTAQGKLPRLPDRLTRCGRFHAAR